MLTTMNSPICLLIGLSNKQYPRIAVGICSIYTKNEKKKKGGKSAMQGRRRNFRCLALMKKVTLFSQKNSFAENLAPGQKTDKTGYNHRPIFTRGRQVLGCSRSQQHHVRSQKKKQVSADRDFRTKKSRKNRRRDAFGNRQEHHEQDHNHRREMFSPKTATALWKAKLCVRNRVFSIAQLPRGRVSLLRAGNERLESKNVLPVGDHTRAVQRCC